MSVDRDFLNKATARARAVAGTALNLLAPTSEPQPTVTVKDGSGQYITIPAHQNLSIYQNAFDIELSPTTGAHSNLLSTGGAVEININENGGGGFLDRVLIEFDVTNSSGAACTLVPSPLLIDNVQIMTMGAGNLLQTIPGDHLFTDLAYLSDNNLATIASYLNSTASLGAPTAIAAGATVDYAVPILSSFFTQGHIYLPAIKGGGFLIRVNFRSSSDTLQSGAVPTISNIKLHLHGATLPKDDHDRVVAQYASSILHFKFSNSFASHFPVSISANNPVSLTLTSMTGVYAGGFLIIRASQTKADLHTYVPLGNGRFNITDGNNNSLNGIPKRGEFNRVWDWQNQFDNTVSTSKAIYVVSHGPSLKTFLDHGTVSGCNTYDGLNKIELYPDSTWTTGSYVVSYLAKQYATLRVENGFVKQSYPA